MRVTKTEFIFTGRGGERSIPHGLDVPADAANIMWDVKSRTLRFTVPADTLGADPTERAIDVTQAQIDAAQVAIDAPDLDQLRANKINELKRARDAAWQGVLLTTFGMPFKTDVQTQLDITLMIQNLAPGSTFEGYKCADGVRRDITREQFQRAMSEGIARKVQAYRTEAIRLAALEAAETEAEIKAITFD